MSNQVRDCFKFLWPFQNVRTLCNPKTFLTHFSQQAMPLLSRLFKSTTSSENVMQIKVSDTKATTKEIRRASQDREEEKKRCQPVNHTRLYVPHEKIKSHKTCRVESFGNWRISLDRPIDFISMNSGTSYLFSVWWIHCISWWLQ